MTAKKDLKRRVRERMAATGENYTTALERVREASKRPSLIEQAPPARDISAIAQREGFPCPTSISERTWDALEASEGGAAEWLGLVFERLRRMLIASMGDPSADAFRMRTVLGELPPRALTRGPFSLQFYRRINEGHRGCSPDGSWAVFDVPRKDGGAAVVSVWVMTTSGDGKKRRLCVAVDRERSGLHTLWSDAMKYLSWRR